MPLQNITYSEIVDLVKNFIKTKCQNISGYGGMSGAVKNGYSFTVASVLVATVDLVEKREQATATLTSPLSSAVSPSVVDTDMTNYLTSVGINSYLSSNISSENFLKFMNDIMTFCTTKLGYISSQTGIGSTSFVEYLVYNTSNTTYNNSITITNSSEMEYLIKANDVQQILQYIVNNMTNKIRVMTCKYTFSIT